MATRIARPRPKVRVDTRPPGADDDLIHGFQYFSMWLYEDTEELYVCIDPANGAAVWQIVGEGEKTFTWFMGGN